MYADTRHDLPFFNSDPRSSLPVSLVEECEDPGTCYPSDDGEADFAGPGPEPTPEAATQHPGFQVQSFGDRIASALRSFLEGLFGSPTSLASPARA